MTARNRLMLLVASLLSFAAAHAQVDPQLYSDMHWREIGPMRAGRTRALAGVPSEPATFYLGAVNGGVWKTHRRGRDLAQRLGRRAHRLDRRRSRWR